MEKEQNKSCEEPAKDMSDKKKRAQAMEHYLRGKELWSHGEQGAAMTEYNKAIALDASSPAVEALAMAERIMAFYHRDLYNP